LNALSTLGGQQQTIAQNKELFPLQNLTTLSGLLRGYTTPTTTRTTAEMSPLSAVGTVGAGLAGLLQTPAGGGANLLKGLTGSTSLPQLFKDISNSNWFGSSGIPVDANGNYDTRGMAGETIYEP